MDNRDLLPVLEDPFMDNDATDLPDRNTSSTFASLFGLSRRRRNTNRPLRPATESAASTSRPAPNSTLRGEAAEFVPSVSPRISTKRKASSSARSGKSATTNPRSKTVNPGQPIIRAEDLFGTFALPQQDGDSLAILLEDDDHSDSFDVDRELRNITENYTLSPQNHREQIREALARVRSSRAVERNNIKRPADIPPSSSAILFACDNVTASPDQPGSQTRLRYLPLVPTTSAGGRAGTITKDTNLTILPSYRQRVDNASGMLTPTNTNWPLNELPKELFDLITDHLSRDDVKSMRLVCTEFEGKVSDTLFNTSVVPFNTELYDMIDEDAKASTRSSQAILRSRAKGKARARDDPDVDLSGLHAGLHWQNDKDDAEGKVYQGYGLRVFQGFGPHIKRFGMSFEVAEAQLARPPVKQELDHVESYHGGYEWPPQQYTRFANLAGLERTADETLRMKAAFANLKKVQELGLSVESGLGWLNGPDKSLRARIFERPASVFGRAHARPSQEMQDAQDFWEALRACHRSMGVVGNPKEISLGKKTLVKPISELPGVQDTRFAEANRWPSISAANINAATLTAAHPGDSRHGVLFTTLSHADTTLAFDKTALVPSELRKEQKEWLLETEWAQRAFLECYILAIIDNPVVVANVRTLNIAKISSSFLPILGRRSFWDALPNLTDVTIHVKPDWKTVEKDNAGFAETRVQNPSEAVRLFHRCILRDRVCLRPSITKLNIGWFGGGEHADGMFARNNNILPAPLTQPEHSVAPSAGFGLVFKFVEHLTLHNCWITPPGLEELIKSHSDKALRRLTLDSVSLTAHPRFPSNGQAVQQAHAIAAMQANIAAAPANVQPHLAVNGAAPMLPPNVPQIQWPLLNNMANAPPAGQLQQQMLNHINVLAPNFIPVNHQLQQLNQLGMPNHIPVHNLTPPVVAPPPQANVNNTAPRSDHWSESLREGSWPELLNKISPGPIFSDYLPPPNPWEEQLPPREETTLQSIELESCGYARLANNNAFDQFAIQATDDHHLSVWFRARQAALSPAMMTSNDRYLARLVQHIPNREFVACLLAWGLREGWRDREKAEEAEYDGLLPGGTGRLTGTIFKGMPPISGPAPA